MHAAFHDDRAVRENQCFIKCSLDSSLPECGGSKGYASYCESNPADKECQSGSNMLCLSQEQLQGLCESVEDCDAYSYRAISRSGKGFSGGELHTAACRTQVKNGADTVCYRELSDTP
jgi:hypothetical protein